MSNEKGIVPSSGGICRRDFLVLSSTCAIGALAVGPRLFANPATTASIAAPHALAIGFAPLGDEAGIAAGTPSTGFMSAESIGSGDGGFIGGGARVQIAGVGGDPSSRWITSIRPEYEVADVGRVPVYAWAYNRKIQQGSGNSAFRLPLDSQQTLRFDFQGPGRSERGRAVQELAASDGHSLELTLLSDSPALKLRRGYYAIVPLFGTDAAPDWQQYTVRKDNQQWLLSSRDEGGQALAREHVVLRIDYENP